MSSGGKRGETMALFFTSDTHFGHAQGIRRFHRPFASVYDMDEAMVARWNETVGAGDVVYHLGDAVVKAERPPSEYLPRLAGEKHLIIGNHDEKMLEMLRPFFASVQHILTIEPGGQRIVLCHYPMRDWWKMRDGAWHLFGHVHGELDTVPFGKSMDVGVDSNDFRPWSEDAVVARLTARPMESDRVRAAFP
jgi:calcineurin-like phosphoesterase family protein